MKNNIFKRITAAILCICALASVGFTFNGCDKKEAYVEEPITVFRLTDDVDEGKRISKARLEEITLLPSQAPEGAILSSDESAASGYYATTDMLAGDYLVEGKVSTKVPEDKIPVSDPTEWITDQNSDDYIIVKPQNGDMYEEIQAIIDGNPNRTIYFPDGVYNVSKTLVISSEPEKRVSLRLSQYAVISVTSSWKNGEPVIHFGKDESADASNIDAAGARAYISGGTIDSKNKAVALRIDGKGNMLINHMAFKNFMIAIQINTNHVDVDSLSGTGNSSKSSGYIDVNGMYNTITNLRMCHGYYGIKLTKEYNVLRNLHPLIGAMREDPGTIGFWDLSAGNFYDYCYGDQHAMTFKLCDGNTSVLNGCYGYWYSSANGRHWGIYADGRFNSVVIGTRIDMCHPNDVSNAYLKVKEDGGNGKIITSYYQSGDDNSADFRKYLVKN